MDLFRDVNILRHKFSGKESENSVSPKNLKPGKKKEKEKKKGEKKNSEQKLIGVSPSY